MTIFKGTFTALLTPFIDDKVDEEALRHLVNWQIEQGIHGLVPTGTTGESPTLSHEEHNQVVEICISEAKNRVPVIAGTGSNSTSEAIMMTQHAADVGADAALVVTPYYNKPNQEGMYQHFKAIHDAVDLPIIVYNIPGRSIIDLHDDTLCRLSELPRIVGVKDATSDLSRPAYIHNQLGDSFCQLSGEDGTALEFNEAGGVGCISVTSNIAPKLVAEVQDLWSTGQKDEAQALHRALQPLHDVMFCETSPAPVKYAAKLMGLCNGELRLPLIEITDEHKRDVEAVLQQLQLI